MHLDWWTCQGTFPHTLSLTGAPPPVPPPTLVWIGWNQLSRAAGPQRWHYTSMKFPLTFHCCHRVKSQDNQVHFVLRKLTAQSKVCRMALKWDATGCLGCQSYEVIGYKVPGREKGFFFFVAPTRLQSWDKSQFSVLLNQKLWSVCLCCSVLQTPQDWNVATIPAEFFFFTLSSSRV